MAYTVEWGHNGHYTEVAAGPDRAWAEDYARRGAACSNGACGRVVDTDTGETVMEVTA